MLDEMLASADQVRKKEVNADGRDKVKHMTQACWSAQTIDTQIN